MSVLSILSYCQFRDTVVNKKSELKLQTTEVLDLVEQNISMVFTPIQQLNIVILPGHQTCVQNDKGC